MGSEMCIRDRYNTDPVFNVATSLPSYVLSEAVMPDTVNAFAVMLAVIVA